MISEKISYQKQKRTGDNEKTSLKCKREEKSQPGIIHSAKIYSKNEVK